LVSEQHGRGAVGAVASRKCDVLAGVAAVIARVAHNGELVGSGEECAEGGMFHSRAACSMALAGSRQGFGTDAKALGGPERGVLVIKRSYQATAGGGKHPRSAPKHEVGAAGEDFWVVYIG